MKECMVYGHFKERVWSNLEGMVLSHDRGTPSVDREDEQVPYDV